MAVYLVIKECMSDWSSTSYSFSAIVFLIIGRVLNITAFCIRIFRPGQRLSSFILLRNLFRIIPVTDSTSSII